MAEDLEEDFDDADGDDDGAAEPKRRGGSPLNKRLILMVVLPLLLVVVAGAGAFFVFGDQLMGLFKGGEGGGHEPKAAVEATVQQPAVFYDLPEMLVNLNVQGRKQAFLKIRVSLELETPLDTPKVEAAMPRIVDNFQVYLRELRVEDLQGASGMYRLREELLKRVNAAAKPAKVNDVLFKEMLVQ